MNRMNTLLCATLALAAWTAGPAEARETKLSTTFAYGDLDLTTPEGAAELERRARVAVLRMCGTYDRRSAVGDRPMRRCKQSASINPAVAALVAQARLDATTRGGTRVAAK